MSQCFIVYSLKFVFNIFTCRSKQLKMLKKVKIVISGILQFSCNFFLVKSTIHEWSIPVVPDLNSKILFTMEYIILSK